MYHMNYVSKSYLIFQLDYPLYPNEHRIQILIGKFSYIVVLTLIVIIKKSLSALSAGYEFQLPLNLAVGLK